MGKSLLVASFALLVLLAFGTQIAPDSPMFWLASSEIGYQVVRFGLILIVLLQLATNPPRNRVFRAISGTVAVGIAVWTLRATYANNMMLLDSLCLLGSAVSIGLVALERKVSLRTQPAIKAEQVTA